MVPQQRCPFTPAMLRDLPEHMAAALPTLLHALWHDAHGHWDRAHNIAQDVDTPEGAWVHAYLHRREGDLSNAGYWYRRAGKPPATGPLEAEWESLVNTLFAQATTS